MLKVLIKKTFYSSTKKLNTNEDKQDKPTEGKKKISTNI